MKRFATKIVMNNVKNKQEKIPCFECDAGILQPVVEDYQGTLENGEAFTVPKVKMQQCNKCGDTVIGAEGNKKIDRYITKLSGIITPEEVGLFLKKYSLTQREASEITGLGEKNISRWLTGKARASESVSKYLRLLIADENSFQRLKAENWEEVPAA